MNCPICGGIKDNKTWETCHRSYCTYKLKNDRRKGKINVPDIDIKYVRAELASCKKQIRHLQKEITRLELLENAYKNSKKKVD